MTTSTRRLDRPSAHEEPPEAVSLGWIGLFVPFALVLLAVLLLGSRSAPQLAMTLVLLVIPLAILLMRRTARRKRMGGSRFA